MPAEKRSDRITLFLSENDALGTPKEKIAHALLFMESCLKEANAPFFKGFWAAKDRAFEQLKTASQEGALWGRYKELTEEFAKVKALVQQQSRFTLEQVDLALTTLKTKIEEFTTQEPPVAPLQETAALAAEELLSLQQKEGSARVVKSFIDQLIALRGEVIASPGIFKNKSKLIDELNSLIDRLLPLRKEAQQNLSSVLQELIIHLEKQNLPAHARLGRIKSLQALLKELTLHPKSFQQARQMLSRLWEEAKAAQDTYKQGQAEKRKAEEALVTQMRSRLEEIRGSVEKYSPDQAKDASRNFKGQLKRLRLPPKESEALVAELDTLLDPVFEKEAATRRKALDELERDVSSKKGQMQLLQALLEQGEKSTTAEELDTLLTKAETLLQGLTLTLEERVHLEPLYQSLVDKRLYSQLESASPEDRRVLLDHCYALKNASADSLDLLKKTAHATAQDFHQALLNHQLVDMETLRLQKLEETIQSLEEELEVVENQ